MRPSIREDILRTSTVLFNERGYGNVSLRDISGALGISVGNLNYYFAKKQDILQAIMERNFLLTAAQEDITTLAQLHEFLGRMLDSLSAHAFYFRDPSIHGLNLRGEENVNGLYHIFVRVLEELKAQGLFQDGLTPERLESLVKVLMLSHLAWIQPSPQYSAVQGMTREEFLTAHWLLLDPYFTDRGREEYRRTVKA